MLVMNPHHHAQACQEITQLVLWSWLIGKRRCWIFFFFLRFQHSVTSYVRSHIKRIEPSHVFSFHMHGSCSTSSKSLIEMQLSHIFILFAEPHCEHRDIPPSLSLPVTHTPTCTPLLSSGWSKCSTFPLGSQLPEAARGWWKTTTAVAMQESIGASFSYTLAQEQLAYIVFRTCHTFTLSADATDKRADSPF